MNNHSEILLSLSIADDDMQRAVHMFPEVFYMDVIANTNRQKRDLFVLVLKDASGETNIGNASVLPCGKLWDFFDGLPKVSSLPIWRHYAFSFAIGVD